jgi:hypothetical protein
MAAVGAAGCSGPLEGFWEHDNEVACPGGGSDRATLDIRDGAGNGEVCNCNYTFTVEDRGDDKYIFDVDFDSGCGFGDGRYDCDLETDVRLDCGSQLGDFYRKED